MNEPRYEALEQIEQMLEAENYVAGHEIALSIYLARTLEKPLLVEGPAGVGKTEIAKVMASALQTDMIRLQCYEGLDAASALYEWNYQHQLLHLKMDEQSGRSPEQKSETLFSDTFLLKRPLLQAITADRAPVLLIDELDRADEEFESFLLEVLSEWQISIPEIGPIRATHIPHVVITSNRTRDISDAVRRRCLYLWIDYPDFEKELSILKRKVNGIDTVLAEQICRFMERIRTEDLEKIPGLSETLDWARALVALHRDRLDPQIVSDTLGIVFKERNDMQHVQTSLAEFLEQLGIRPKTAPP
jgi:MoxR-like ATPase